MKYSQSWVAIVLLAIFIVLAGCKDDNEKVKTTSGTLKLKFEHTWETQAFKLGSAYHHSVTHEHVTINQFKYYISNVKLLSTNGSWWKSEECYHLIDLTSSSRPEFVISGIPAGDYIEISYTVGIDSAKNVTGSSVGDLSPEKGMFWNSNDGYIFLLLEGLLEGDSTNKFSYSIGGFKESNGGSAIENITQNFNGQLLTISSEAAPSVHFMIDVATIWDNNFKLRDNLIIDNPGTTAQKVSNNFSNSFELDHIHN